MTLNGAITELVMMRENPMMPNIFRPALDKVIETISELEPEPHWIPCTPETVPKDAGTYLCTCADAGRLMITQIKWQPRMKSWNLTGARTYWKVIAWMPLPSPYQPEEE